MFNSKDGYSLADLAAVTDNGNGGLGGGAWWIILIFLFAFGGFGNFGMMNGGGAINNPAVQGAITRADLFEGFNTQDINAQLRGIVNGLSDGFYAQNENTINGFNAVNTGINNLGFQVKDCCCETNRNIDAVRYENSRNTNDIVSAIREDGQATRALINAHEMQELRERIADKDRELMTANFQISQQRQNDYLVNQIKPCAIPAYLTCSPYESAYSGPRCYGMA